MLRKVPFRVLRPSHCSEWATGVSSKEGTLRSLKRALDLPLQTPNEPLLKALGVPSLLQVAAYHVTINTRRIRERFQACPDSLGTLAVELTDQASEYRKLQRPTAIVKVRSGTYLVDLLASRSFLDKCYIGLVAGNFLTIRTESCEPSRVGEIRECPLCRVPASQTHFLNVCPANSVSREALSRSSTPGIHVGASTRSRLLRLLQGRQKP